MTCYMYTELDIDLDLDLLQKDVMQYCGNGYIILQAWKSGAGRILRCRFGSGCAEAVLRWCPAPGGIWHKN